MIDLVEFGFGGMGLESISVVMSRGRPRWFGHMERMSESSGVMRVRDVNVDGRVERGRSVETRDWEMKNDLLDLDLDRGC